MFWKWLANNRYKTIERNINNPLQTQEKIFHQIMHQQRNCKINIEHDLSTDTNIDTFRKNVPINDYHFYQSYTDEIIRGDSSVLFPGDPVYISQTGGTTAAPKQFPLGKHLIRSYRQFNLDMFFSYMVDRSRYDILSGKILLVTANPVSSTTAKGVPCGMATGIMAQIAPALLRRKYVPSLQTLNNPNTEEKIRQIVIQSLKQRNKLQVAAGLTPYLMAIWNHLLNSVNKTPYHFKNLSELCPNLSVAFHGGTTFNFYQSTMARLAGEGIEHRNVYSAAEGPIAHQLKGDSTGLSLYLDGVFFEFLPPDQVGIPNPRTLLIDEISCNTPYYILLTTQGGLMRYKVGDLIEFINTQPPLIKVLGKPDDYIDLAGEKLGIDEASRALYSVGKRHHLTISDFLVSPAKPGDGDYISHYEWIIESDKRPDDPELFITDLEKAIFVENYRYRELRECQFSFGKPTLKFVRPGTFQKYMENNLYFGEQKILHMSNTRDTATKLLSYQ